MRKTKPCVVCKQPFPTGNGIKFCSTACRRAQRKKQVKRARKAFDVRQAILPRMPTLRQCLQCREPFKTTGKQKTCSDACRNKRHSAQVMASRIKFARLV